jgi:monothiol glutaredoxin
MKGSPSRPQCGFSTAVIQTLAHYGVPYHAFDVLADPPARRAIETFSTGPLYVGGAFIGGYDIVLEMHETGELAEVFGIHRTAAAS